MLYDLDDDDDINDVVAPGGHVKVPLLLCDARAAVFDARNHQPHFYTPLNDAAQRRRTAARDAYVERTVSAWRRPHKDASEPDAAERLLSGRNDDPNERMRRHVYGASPDDDKGAARRRAAEAAYRHRCDALSNAWRNPGNTDPRAANAVEQERRRWTAES